MTRYHGDCRGDGFGLASAVLGLLFRLWSLLHRKRSPGRSKQEPSPHPSRAWTPTPGR